MNRPVYPYVCGEESCVGDGVKALTMEQMTAHWREHQEEEA